MERKDVVTIIEALSPYIYINKEALLRTVIANPITELPQELNDTFNKALLAIAWRDIEGDSAGILDSWDERRITEVTHKISGSGNPTWYCKCEDGKTIYIRQSNKEIMTDVYPTFENMQVGDVVTDVDITIYTTTEGNFLNPEKVMPGGTFNYTGETEAQRKRNVVTQLASLPDDTVYLDVETTGVDESAEIVSIAIVSGDDVYKTFVQPTDIHKLTVKGKGGKSASDINGITENDVKDAPLFPDVYETIKGKIESKSVVTYGDFDKRLIEQDCKRHKLDVPEYTHVDLMALYSEWDGTPSARGGYKRHKLTDVYTAVTKTPLDDAHTALADTQAMIDIVNGLKATEKDALPF